MLASDEVRRRFWAKARKGEACWLWTGAQSSDKYGCFGLDGRTVAAHRVAWMLTNGPIPSGLLVCHSCDNPRCVNPDHLWLGTNADNARDRDQKGRCRARGLPGDRSTNHKLTSDRVTEIRRLVESGEQQKDVAKRFGVHKATVNDLVLRKTWASV